MGAHLSARWPEMFASVCLRNPVTDLASCFATSDIPDWYVRSLRSRLYIAQRAWTDAFSHLLQDLGPLRRPLCVRQPARIRPGRGSG